MEKVENGKDKQYSYKVEYSRFKTALKEEFYLEAISIGYAIIEDRLVAFLHHAGIVTRNHDELRINKAVYPYIRSLLKKDVEYSIKVKDISVKMDIVRKLLEMTEDDAKRIEADVKELLSDTSKKRRIKRAKEGYMLDLRKQILKLNKVVIIQTLEELDKWRDNRNQLIHALLSKKVDSVADVKKQVANRGYEITRDLDNNLVKSFKNNNTLRKKYNIQ